MHNILINPKNIINLANPDYNTENPKIGDPEGLERELNLIQDDLLGRYGIHLMGATVYVEKDESLIYTFAFSFKPMLDLDYRAEIRSYLADWADNNCNFPSAYQGRDYTSDIYFYMLTMKVFA